MRGFYTTAYDRSYVSDLYDHAQYVIPQSFRSIFDELVYQTIGDRLVREQKDPFSVDPQVPPLGKKLYGWSIYLFNNAYILNIFSFCLASMGVYALGRVIGLSEKKSFLTSLLFMLQPLVVVQMRKTMLDLLQTAILLWSLVFLVWQTKQQVHMRIGGCFVAGVLLGFTACVKFGLFLVPILLALLPLLQLPRKQALVCIFALCVGFGLGYSLPYASHISQVGIVQFAKNQKWLVSFWMGAGEKIYPIIGMPVITLVFGIYKHFTSSAQWSLQGEWSPILSLSTIFLLAQLKTLRTWIFSENPRHIPLRVSLFLLLLYCVVPFYPRYLVILTPFLLLVWIGSWSKQFVQITTIMAILFSLILLPFYTKSSLSELVSSLSYSARYGLYKELYEMSDRETPNHETREAFWARNLHAWNQIEGSELTFDVQLARLDHLKSKVDIPYSINYKTYLGHITRKGTLQVNTNGGVRKFKWHDDMIIPYFSKTSKLTVSKVFGRFGTVRNSQGTLLSSEMHVPYLAVLKNEIKDEKVVLDTATFLTGKQVYEVENAFKTNHTSDQLAIVGRISAGVGAFDDLPNGMYAIQMPYIADHLRARYPSTFSVVGGEIAVEEDGNKIVILTRQPTDGKDTVVDK
jgi:hypothetical protein